MNNAGAYIVSVNGALVGEVVPELRCVRIEWDERKLRIFCYYDCELTPAIIEHMRIVETEVIADFNDVAVELQTLSWAVPKRLPTKGVFVYLRRERPLDPIE